MNWPRLRDDEAKFACTLGKADGCDNRALWFISSSRREPFVCEPSRVLCSQCYAKTQPKSGTIDRATFCKAGMIMILQTWIAPREGRVARRKKRCILPIAV
jgi:hypothetical protein